MMKSGSSLGMPFRRLKMIALGTLGSMAATIVAAQVGTQEKFDHHQFCDKETVEDASPLRATLIYLDIRRIAEGLPAKTHLPDLKSAESANDRRVAVQAFTDQSAWYQQLRAKLDASLLPSESVSLMAVDSDAGRVIEIATQCWPAYTDKQLEDFEEQSSFFSRDPTQDLFTQQGAFFNELMHELIENLLSVETNNSPDTQYVRALTSDEGRMRTKSTAKYVRVIVFGDLVEKSDLADVKKLSKGEMSDAAGRAVAALRFNARGAYFYMYGVRAGEVGNKARSFWTEYLSQADGYLMSFGSDLAISGETVQHYQRVKLDITLDRGDVRPAMLSLAAGNSTGLQDSDVVVSNHYRSSLDGRLVCEDFHNPCESSCSIEAEIRGRVLFDTESGRNEEIKLRGTGAALAGTIGTPGPEGVNMYKAEGHFVQCR